MEKSGTYSAVAIPRTKEAFRNRACSLPYNHPDYVAPGPEEVAALIELAGFSQNQTAKLAGVKYDPLKGSSTVRKWKAKRDRKEYRQIPYSAWRLLLLYAGVVTIDDGYFYVIKDVAND
jgi:hypothetical protein